MEMIYVKNRDWLFSFFVLVICAFCRDELECSKVAASMGVLPGALVNANFFHTTEQSQTHATTSSTLSSAVLEELEYTSAELEILLGVFRHSNAYLPPSVQRIGQSKLAYLRRCVHIRFIYC